MSSEKGPDAASASLRLIRNPLEAVAVLKGQRTGLLFSRAYE